LGINSEIGVHGTVGEQHACMFEVARAKNAAIAMVSYRIDCAGKGCVENPIVRGEAAHKVIEVNALIRSNSIHQLV
jgi:hypothetical protein